MEVGSSLASSLESVNPVSQEMELPEACVLLEELVPAVQVYWIRIVPKLYLFFSLSFFPPLHCQSDVTGASPVNIFERELRVSNLG